MEMQYRVFKPNMVEPADDNSYRWLFTGAGVNRMGETTDISGIRVDGRSVPLLFNHDKSLVIGRAYEFDHQDDALYGRVIFDTKDELGAKIERQVREGYLEKASIGFNIIEEELNEERAAENYPAPFDVKRMELLEVSVVSVPADNTANVQRNLDRLNKARAVVRNTASENQITASDFRAIWREVRDNG